MGFFSPRKCFFQPHDVTSRLLGASPPHPYRGCAPGPRWDFRPQNPCQCPSETKILDPLLAADFYFLVIFIFIFIFLYRQFYRK